MGYFFRNINSYREFANSDAICYGDNFVCIYPAIKAVAPNGINDGLKENKILNVAKPIIYINNSLNTVGTYTICAKEDSLSLNTFNYDNQVNYNKENNENIIGAKIGTLKVESLYYTLSVFEKKDLPDCVGIYMENLNAKQDIDYIPDTPPVIEDSEFDINLSDNAISYALSTKLNKDGSNENTYIYKQVDTYGEACEELNLKSDEPLTITVDLVNPKNKVLSTWDVKNLNDIYINNSYAIINDHLYYHTNGSTDLENIIDLGELQKPYWLSKKNYILCENGVVYELSEGVKTIKPMPSGHNWIQFEYTPRNTNTSNVTYTYANNRGLALDDNKELYFVNDDGTLDSYVDNGVDEILFAQSCSYTRKTTSRTIRTTVHKSLYLKDIFIEGQIDNDDYTIFGDIGYAQHKEDFLGINDSTLCYVWNDNVEKRVFPTVSTGASGNYSWDTATSGTLSLSINIGSISTSVNFGSGSMYELHITDYNALISTNSGTPIQIETDCADIFGLILPTTTDRYTAITIANGSLKRLAYDGNAVISDAVNDYKYTKFIRPYLANYNANLGEIRKVFAIRGKM